MKDEGNRLPPIKEIVLLNLNFKENNFFAVNLNSKRVMKTAENLPSVYFKILFALCMFEQGQTVSINHLKNFIDKDNLDTENAGQIIDILDFWRKNGFINYNETVEDSQKPDVVSVENEPIILVDDVCEVLETQPLFRQFIKDGQNILGKIFNPKDLQIMYKLYSIYKIDERLLIALMKICKQDNHASVGYFEKNAIDLYSNGIFTYEQYEKVYADKKKGAEAEPKIKEIFMMQDKKFNTKEKTAIRKWITEYNYGYDIIKMAYDICMEKLEKYQFNYIAAIISNWEKNGCKTIDDIEIIQEKYGYNNMRLESSSFDLDQFFEKAIQIGMKNDK